MKLFHHAASLGNESSLIPEYLSRQACFCCFCSFCCGKKLACCVWHTASLGREAGNSAGKQKPEDRCFRAQHIEQFNEFLQQPVSIPANVTKLQVYHYIMLPPLTSTFPSPLHSRSSPLPPKTLSDPSSWPSLRSVLSPISSLRSWSSPVFPSLRSFLSSPPKPTLSLLSPKLYLPLHSLFIKPSLTLSLSLALCASSDIQV